MEKESTDTNAKTPLPDDTKPGSGDLGENGAQRLKNQLKKGAVPGLLAQAAPFILPALFFESAVLAFISPIPLFILTLRKHIGLSLCALAANAALIYSAGANRNEVILGTLFWFVIGIFFPYLIRRLGLVRESFAISFLFATSLILGGLYYFSHQIGMAPIEYAKSEISIAVDRLTAIPDSPRKKLIEEQGRDEVLRQLTTEVPSGILISMILALWLNLLFASQLIKGFLSKTFWANYRNPEWLIWPLLVSAGLFAFTDHAPYYIGLNAFKVILVFYGFQGLSILSHLLNRYKILGLGRAVVFSVAVFIAMPLVLSLGFFDLWFDFRKKFGSPK